MRMIRQNPDVLLMVLTAELVLMGGQRRSYLPFICSPKLSKSPFVHWPSGSGRADYRQRVCDRVSTCPLYTLAGVPSIPGV